MEYGGKMTVVDDAAGGAIVVGSGGDGTTESCESARLVSKASKRSSKLAKWPCSLNMRPVSALHKLSSALRSLRSCSVRSAGGSSELGGSTRRLGLALGLEAASFKSPMSSRICETTAIVEGLVPGPVGWYMGEVTMKSA